MQGYLKLSQTWLGRSSSFAISNCSFSEKFRENVLVASRINSCPIVKAFSSELCFLAPFCQGNLASLKHENDALLIQVQKWSILRLRYLNTDLKKENYHFKHRTKWSGPGFGDPCCRALFKSQDTISFFNLAKFWRASKHVSVLKKNTLQFSEQNCFYGKKAVYSMTSLCFVLGRVSWGFLQ